MSRGGFRVGAGRPKGSGNKLPTNSGIKAFAVDGSNRCFADVIIENSSSGNTCVVASYGFGIKQVDRLVSFFSELVLIADESHSKLDPKAYKHVTGLSGKNGFTFIPANTHAKIAIINREKVIFTSANLSANRRIEIYFVAPVKHIDGISDILRILGDPQNFLSGDDIGHEKESRQNDGEKLTPLEFLLGQMHNEGLPIDVRAKMAIAAAPFVHARADGSKGKKGEREEKAKAAGSGKFAAGAPPLKVIK
jgi:hypothetical protein